MRLFSPKPFPSMVGVCCLAPLRHTSRVLFTIWAELLHLVGEELLSSRNNHIFISFSATFEGNVNALLLS